MVKSFQTALPTLLSQCYQQACLAEIEAMKPGNVHIFADGHGMVVNDFIQSAEASALEIIKPHYSLGERIYYAFEATWKAVGCNTNLGIVLLCAPLIHAVQHSNKPTLQEKLSEILSATTQQDAQWVFDAIKLAHPAGLGTSAQHDIHHKADCSLLEAMQYSAYKDSIALQYSNDYDDIFTIGLPCYQQHVARWERPAWATSAMYLGWLVTFKDSHVMRKYSEEVAEYLQVEAKLHYEALSHLENPKTYLPHLIQFDQQLKNLDINPGTSADLTVATLLAHSIMTMLNN
jgi:triphosphoribosyl-dephospho-CoA synthase